MFVRQWESPWCARGDPRGPKSTDLNIHLNNGRAPWGSEFVLLEFVWICNLAKSSKLAKFISFGYFVSVLLALANLDKLTKLAKLAKSSKLTEFISFCYFV